MNGDLWEASRIGDVSKVQVAISDGADIECKMGGFNDTPLSMASLEGHIQAIELLIASGAKIDNGNKEGMLPLHYAASAGHVDAALLLINHGADVNRSCGGGRTPLHVASSRGRASIVRLFLEHGADPNSVDVHGRTALQVARMAEYVSEKMVGDVVTVLNDWMNE